MATVEITGNSTMQEVLDAYPGAQRALMRGYHIGGCSSCGFAPGDRLSDVLDGKNVLNVDEVIEFVKRSHDEEQRIQISAQELAEVLKGDTPPLKQDALRTVILRNGLGESINFRHDVVVVRLFYRRQLLTRKNPLDPA